MEWISCILRWLQNEKRAPAKPVYRRVKLNVECLEARAVPTTASLSGGVLSVLGTPGADRILVGLNAATNQIVVQDSGRIIGQFASLSVAQITINTGNGNDRAQIAPQVLQPATIIGGSGKDLLIAGGGPTTIVGGGNTTTLAGGGGTNTFAGGTGNQQIIGGTGTNTGATGTGTTHVQQVKPTDTIATKPADKVLVNNPNPASNTVAPELSAADVQQLLQRATAATASNDAIIAIVDRNGRILGVSVDNGVSPLITGNTAKEVFAVDGAVSLARSGAFFSSDAAPLTSRTVFDLSQSTITQREVESNPNILDPNSTLRGPGYVAPVEIGAHFPPGIANTPEVDLFAIEHTNRDSIINPGLDGIKGTADDVTLPARFNINTAFVPAGQTIFAPESFGFVSGLMKGAQSRGIATLPGGLPIYKNGSLVGGIGVFFPGKTGFATEENSRLSSTFDSTKPDRTLEAEFIAFAAEGGSAGLGINIGAIDGVPPVAGITFPGGPNLRIDLVGITLDGIGPLGAQGPGIIAGIGRTLGVGHSSAGHTLAVDTANHHFLAGLPVPSGWLVTPHDGVGVTAAEVAQIVNNGIRQAWQTRSALRLPLNSSARMVFAVSDRDGNVVGLYRMPDAPVFSIDVAVAKARNVNYYADPAKLQAIDQLPGIPAGTALTNRTFRFLALPRYPSGAEGAPPGYFSILNDGGVDPATGKIIGAPLPASAFQSVLGYDSFHPDTNFRDKTNLLNRNGIVFFPGSAPIYRLLASGFVAQIGGFGVSGDGVDQDDVITVGGQAGFEPRNNVSRADAFYFRGVRLPYQKFNRNPTGGIA